MDEPVKSDSRLEVSVSFGRFENDALSWEKWSSFSPNKYLDEAGSLSTPGSVAQKKAYFEAHYKKIATLKSEQENPMEPVASSQDEPIINDHNESSSGMHANFESCNGEKSNGVVAHEAMVDEAKNEDTSTVVVEQGTCSNGFTDMVILEEEKEEASTAIEDLNAMDEEAKKELNVLVADPGSNREEALPVEEETPLKDPEHAEHPPESKNTVEQVTEPRKRSSKLNAGNINQKVTQTKTERNLTGTKIKVASPAVKHSLASTPKYSKPSLISTPTSASLSGKKKLNRSMVVESKRVAPTSLHMSLSLGPAKSLNPFGMTRKSLIMEKMGDKDIVRRAFKSFQSQINGHPADEKSSTLKQVSSTTSEMKISPSLTPRKENKGLRNAAEKMANRRNQSDQQSKPLLSSRSHKSSGLDKKNTTVVSPSVILKGDEKAEKRKEFLRNLEAKSIAREAENAQLGAKSKDEKTPEVRKLRQSHNFKATPLPSFYRRQGKDHPEKDSSEGSKAAQRRPAAASSNR
ncbi:protein WVD2-like 7 isoform X2 [Henckelia pumila]|uniref:protein WVD2-like 7 isoform X2 n=1 Tax=Henckelia pumila TaxID=405737 RepID=UPI003C6E2470